MSPLLLISVCSHSEGSRVGRWQLQPELVELAAIFGDMLIQGHTGFSNNPKRFCLFTKKRGNFVASYNSIAVLGGPLGYIGYTWVGGVSLTI